MKIGFLGAGKLGQAILEGLINSKKYQQKNIKIVIKSDRSLKLLKDKKFLVSQDWTFLDDCKVIILALTPQDINRLKDKLKNAFTNKIIISVASGFSLTKLNLIFNKCLNTRIMTSTSCQFNQALTMICLEGNSEANKVTLDIFDNCGKTIILSEQYIHNFIATYGSASGYLYYWLQPLMENLFKTGISLENSKIIISSLLLGVASNILNNDLSLQELTNNVCSPGGTTIEAIDIFEKNNFQEIIDQALEACLNKSIQLENDK